MILSQVSPLFFSSGNPEHNTQCSRLRWPCQQSLPMTLACNPAATGDQQNAVAIRTSKKSQNCHCQFTGGHKWDTKCLNWFWVPWFITIKLMGPTDAIQQSISKENQRNKIGKDGRGKMKWLHESHTPDKIWIKLESRLFWSPDTRLIAGFYLLLSKWCKIRFTKVIKLPKGILIKLNKAFKVPYKAG